MEASPADVCAKTTYGMGGVLAPDGSQGASQSPLDRFTDQPAASAPIDPERTLKRFTASAATRAQPHPENGSKADGWHRQRPALQHRSPAPTATNATDLAAAGAAAIAWRDLGKHRQEACRSDHTPCGHPSCDRREPTNCRSADMPWRIQGADAPMLASSRSVSSPSSSERPQRHATAPPSGHQPTCLIAMDQGKEGPTLRSRFR